MYDSMKLKQARQNVADTNAMIAALKHEGNTLLAITASKRTDNQQARINEITAAIDQKSATAAVLTRELADLERVAADDKRQAINGGDQSRILKPSGRRYAEMFGAQSISMGDWKDANDYLSAIHTGRADERLMFAPTDMSAMGKIGSAVDGGFSVPTQLAAEWLDASLEKEIVRPRATIWPMTSSTRQVPGFDATTAASSQLFGGFSGGWYAEGAEMNLKNPKMRLIELVARKLGILTEVSNELLRDGLGYAEQLSGAIVGAMGWFLDDACFNGGGANKPIGVINAPCTISVTKENAQAASTVNYTNLTKMFARLHPSCYDDAVWVANQSTIPQLTQLQIAIGTAGAHVPVMTQSNGKFYILTKEVIFSERVPTLGTKGDIGLYSFKNYAIGLRQDMILDKSMHPGFTRDTSHYRCLLRGNGLPTWDQPYTPKNGPTLSPFVVLETRA